MEFSSSPDVARESIEKQIVSLYSEMLHQSDIKEADNFLHLGGSSLTAAKLLARVRAIFGVNVSLRSFFADPTPAGLATALRTARTEGGTEVVPGARTGTAPGHAESILVRRADRAALDAEHQPRRLFESFDKELELVSDVGPRLPVFLLPDHVKAT